MVLGLFTIVLAADSPLKWSGVLNIRHTQRELLAGVLAVRAVLLDSEYVGQGVRNRNSVRRPDPAERKIGLTRRFAGKVDPVELSGCRGLREPAAAAIGITRKGRTNVIVDAQIHLWEKGTPSAHHRQEPYSAEQAIAGMDKDGVDRALIHPVLWDRTRTSWL